MGNKEIFDRIASEYDTIERVEIAEICIDAIKNFLTDTEGKSAIDFGCGTGLVGLGLADRFQKILFVDASQNMIRYVEEKINNNHLQNAEAVCLDLETESNRVEKVDYIIAVQVLLHIKDVDDILGKLNTFLKNDGHLIIIDFDKNNAVVSDQVHNGFKQSEIEAILKKASYKNINYEIFYHGENIFMNKDASMFIVDAKKVGK